MHGLTTSALRLLTQYVRLGGLAGTAVFTVQGEFAKALWCAVISGICIVILALATLLADSLKN